MKRTTALFWAVVLLAAPHAWAEELRPLRYPSVPLVACDPYFSIWSNAEHLTEDVTRHWTGRPHPLTSLIRIDDKPYRVMGAEPKDVPPLNQVSLDVLPTRTIYRFVDAGIELTLTFMTAALPDDLMVLSRPVTYLTWDCHAVDGKEHQVWVYFDTTADIAVNDRRQPVEWSRIVEPGLAVLRVGTTEQPILRKKGDDLRIDWGHYYVAVPDTRGTATAFVDGRDARDVFRSKGRLGNVTASPKPAAEAPALVVEFDLGRVGQNPDSRWLMLAYDEVYSIQYFRKNLRPYWRKDGAEAADLLKAAARDYPALCERCAAFDRELVSDLKIAGGEKYARIGSLAHRECLAGNHLAADANGRPLLFPKENTSNGCIGTVDVIYPMAPQFLLFGPTLTKAMLISNLDYASSPRWKWPFAPHDLGTYPLANGQVYGGGERTEENQMPVEESGNMLILVAALARMEGNPDFAAPYWPVLRRWAEYLRAKGFDPENQLCTDDFAGHLAHNVNLSAKAIVALGAYAYLCELRGEKAESEAYRKLAREYAARWVKEADDGDHFRLTFNGPKTWSQKYNLVWDRLLGLDLFPPDALRKEMAFYKTHQNRFGLPLDSRKDWTKLDWTLWTATLTGEREDFTALVDPVYEFLDKTPTRVPMSDFYWTKDGRDAGMHARPVVGGVFLKLLYDQKVWKKWAGRDRTPNRAWAPLPTPPKITPVVPASEKLPAVWRYTTTKPGPDWFKPGFDASSWKEGPAGFGAGNPPGSVVRTPWKTDDIWLIREVTLPEGKWHDLQCWIHHDEDVEVYINGVLALREPGYLVAYEAIPLTPAGKAALKPGKNRIAVHCHQTTGGQYIDLGFVDVSP